MGLSHGLCLAQQNERQQKEVHPTLGRCSQVKLANRRQVGPTFKTSRRGNDAYFTRRSRAPNFQHDMRPKLMRCDLQDSLNYDLECTPSKSEERGYKLENIQIVTIFQPVLFN